MTKTIETKQLSDIATWMTSIQKTDLPNILSGIFFMDGNPPPDTCLTMYNLEWDSVNFTLFVPVYAPVQWTFHNSIPGWLLLHTVQIAQLTYKMQFDATLHSAQITPFIFGFPIPKWIGNLSMCQIEGSSNGDTWKRENVWLGGISSIGGYTLRRVVNADGSYTPVFKDMLDKAPNECLVVARN